MNWLGIFARRAARAVRRVWMGRVSRWLSTLHETSSTSSPLGPF